MGCPAIGNICLGIDSVSGRSRVPSPPTRTTAFTGQDFGAVVDVVEEPGAVVDVEDDGAVVVDPGAVVLVDDEGVLEGVVVVEVVLLDALSSAVTTVPLGLGSLVPGGTKPMVMS